MAKKILICTTCGEVGVPKKMYKGSLIGEIGFWGLGFVLLFLTGFLGIFVLLGAFVYSIWRYTGSNKSCPKCQGENMIPTDTVVGAKLLKEHPQAQTDKIA